MDSDELVNLQNLPSLPVLASIQAVAARCRWVRFHPQALDKAVAQWGHLLTAASTWEHPCHFFDGSEETARWVFVVEVLNHCFWPDVGAPVWTVSYQGTDYSGYWGLVASLKRAHQAGFPITAAETLAAISAEDLHTVFAGEGEIPLFDQRLINLHEAGRVLLEQWDGDVVHLVEAAQGSAVRAVGLLTASVPSFRDEAWHGGLKVYFWKRAQIFAADLYHAFSGRAWGSFHDIHQLSAFADYKLPQVLRQLGIISYHADLAATVDAQRELAAGSEPEVEIRAFTIRAVEALRTTFLLHGKQATSMQIDNWLWQLGQRQDFRHQPYHRCRTIYY
jgi:hypothetical protein